MRIFYVLGCLAVISLASCHHVEHHAHEEGTYLATSPVKRDTQIAHEYVCQIRSIQHIELRALEKGYLQNIYVDEGQRVKKGQLLFQVMPILYQAETQKAQAEVDFAAIEYQTTKSLADSNIVSKNELALAKAKLDKAQAELNLAKAHLGFTEIRAPFDGIIGRFNEVRLGALVEEGAILTTLSDNSKMWVYFNVPEAEYLDYAMKQKDGKPSLVRLQMANKQVYEQMGTIETIEADFNNETGNIAFRATFANPTGLLRHGETGNILMPVDLKGALLIPQKSTFEVLDKKYVYVIDSQSVARSQEIVVGVEMPHLYQVVEGLSEKDKILVEGLRKVKNNQHVKYSFQEQEKILGELANLEAQ